MTATQLDAALERALALAAAGFYVFPSWAKNRHPAGWPQRATRDEATIRQWFTGPFKDCWPSIATGKYGDGSQALLVVDVDPRGIAAVECGALDSLLPTTRVHRTPRGGMHGFYVLPFPGVRQGTNVLADGVDVRSKGGLIFFGEGYVLEQDEPIAQAPTALIAKCGELAPVTAPADRAQDRVAADQEAAYQRAEEIMSRWPAIAEGARNEAVRDFTYRIREKCGTDAEGTMALGLAFAAERCVPPYPEDEARATIASAMRSAQNPAGSAMLTEDDFPVPVQESAAAAIERASAKAKARGGTLQDLAKRRNSGAYLVKGLLRRKSHAVMYGAPGQGKSYVALDLSHRVAAGREWMGRRVNGGPVLYLAFEGLGGMPERAAALLQHFGAAPVPLVVEPCDLNLREKAGREALGARIAEIRAEHFGGRQPVLIVIDTLARSMRGGDENSAADMGALNDAVTALIEATGAAVLLIHHSGKDANKGARGSSALLGAVDTEIEVSGGQLRATKQRDMAPGEPIGFKLQPVTVGEDEDGDPLQACVVVPDAAPAASRRQLTGQTKDAEDALRALAQNNAPVAEDAWQAAFERKAWPVDPPEPKSRRVAFRRAVKALGERVESPAPGYWQRAMLG